MPAQKPLHFTAPPAGAPMSDEPALAVTPAIYALAKCTDARAALAYLIEQVPESVYRALHAHIAGRPALLSPSIRNVVVAFLESPKELREAEAAFAHVFDTTPAGLSSFDVRFFA